MVIKEKMVELIKGFASVQLKETKYEYQVVVGGNVFYRSPNIMFATQVFNAI